MRRALDEPLPAGPIVASARRFDRAHFDASDPRDRRPGAAASAAPSWPRDAEPSASARLLLDATRPLAKLAFGLLLVLSPFRARIELLARPTPPLYGDYTDFLLFWSDLAALLTLALWAVSLWARRGWRSVSLGPPFLSVPIAGLLALGWIGIPFAVDPALAAYTAIRLTVLAALALYVLNEFEGLAQLRVPARGDGRGPGAGRGRAGLRRALGRPRGPGRARAGPEHGRQRRDRRRRVASRPRVRPDRPPEHPRRAARVRGAAARGRAGP